VETHKCLQKVRLAGLVLAYEASYVVDWNNAAVLDRAEVRDLHGV
jgi:hypothetical protein